MPRYGRHLVVAVALPAEHDDLVTFRRQTRRRSPRRGARRRRSWPALPAGRSSRSSSGPLRADVADRARSHDRGGLTARSSPRSSPAHLAPCRRHVEGRTTTSSIAAASAFSSRGGTSKPSTPSSTSSGRPPRSVPITGRPARQRLEDGHRLVLVPGARHDRDRRRAEELEEPSFGRRPWKVTLPGASAAASASSSRRAGPSPAMSRWARVGQVGHGPDGDVDALLGRQPAGDHRVATRSVLRPASAGEVDEVADDVHAGPGRRVPRSIWRARKRLGQTNASTWR